MRAKNSSNARTLHLERPQFQRFMDFSNDKYFLDDFRMIGRIDNNRMPIYPNHQKFVSLANYQSIDRIVAFDFVAMNLQEARNRFNSALDSELINSSRSESLNGLLSRLDPVRGFQDPMRSYSQYYEKISNSFNSKINSNISLKNKIINFSSYASSFMNMIHEEEKDSPIFFSYYSISSLSSVISTGLALEFYDQKYDDDSFKTNKVISNSNFRSFRRIIQDYGFKIDKDVPWRIIADIYSPAMQQKIKFLNPQLSQLNVVSSEQIISKYYSPITNDLPLFIILMLKDYNRFVKQSPTGSKFVENKCLDATNYFKFERQTQSMDKLTLDELRTIFSFYIRIKNRLSGLNISEGEQSVIVNRSLQLASVSLEKAARFIDEKFIYNFNSGNLILRKSRKTY